MPLPSPRPGGPVTPATYAWQAVFEQPEPPRFGVVGSLGSIFSLVVMTALSAVMMVQLLHPGTSLLPLGLLPAPEGEPLAWWTWLPFAFTIFGAGVGALFELGLLLSGIPFQQTRNRFTTFIFHIRLMNLAPVSLTIWFFMCSMVLDDGGLRLAMLLLSAALTGALAWVLFNAGAPLFAGPTLQLLQVAAVVLVVVAGPPPGGWLASGLLIGQALCQLTSLLLGTATPGKSTAFHLISTLSGVLLYEAVVVSTAAQPGFSQQVAVPLGWGSATTWTALALVVGGVAWAMRTFPETWATSRVFLSNTVWSPIWFLLTSAPRFPNPFNLSELYSGKDAPAPTALKPYFLQHPEHLIAALTVPAVVRLEGNVSAYRDVIARAKSTFKAIAFLDHNFPQTQLEQPLTQKPRLPIWSSGEDFWPGIYTREIFGFTVPGRTLEATPQPALDAFREGQLLAYLAESGIGSCMLESVPERGRGCLKLDFRFLEKYAIKPGYAPYGGVAFFRVDATHKRLLLESVVEPHDTSEVPVRPNDGTFRRVEALVLASLYYQVVSGKHLAEIHMTYNLVEVAMHNAFDARGLYNHPLRTFMYLHFFSHELAEELTTEHLVQEGAIFSQIFATTHDGLIDHLNDTYQAMVYGTDEDFERRRAQMTYEDADGTSQLLPRSAVRWEQRYHELWLRYTTRLVEGIYADDAAVEADESVRLLHAGLIEVLVQGLPKRYDALCTRAGLARFCADTIHHMVVRHQVYGTTGVKAMDPRINKTQVPADLGTSGVDEWRTLAGIALATARARFVLLMGDFSYLVKGVDEPYQPLLLKAFASLQEDLAALDREWTEADAEREFNYDYFRPVPSELHTGAGY